MYEEGEQIQPNCSTRCTCRLGKFHCEPQTCLTDGPTCYASGDPHYQTFDLRYYDFQGDCEYMFSQHLVILLSLVSSLETAHTTLMYLVPKKLWC